MAAETTDVCIVGSGAGGGAVAYALARAGLRVLVVEKGPRYGEEDFFHDELAVCRRDFFVPSVLDEPRTVVHPDGVARREQAAWIACCVGGGTVHMSGYFFRMHREDFRLRTLYGAVPGASPADWPVSFDEMEPFYDEAERVLGVSGDASRSPFEPRNKPWPLPPLAAHPCSALIEQAASSIGLHAFPTPRAVASLPWEGRPGCAYCCFCGSYGCEHGAKSSSLVALLRPAMKTGRLTVRSRAMVTRVETDRDGRVRGVLYLDDKGAQHEIRARVVVLAASAVETARLLLASDGSHARHGLANGSGLVGKNLLFAAFASGFGRFPADSPHFPAAARALPFLDRTVQDHYLVEKAGLAHPKAGTILFQLPHVNPIFQATRLAARPGSPPLFGANLKKKLREYFRESHTIEWETFSEFLPHAGADVTLDPDVKDRFGLRVARLRMGIHPTTTAVSDHLATRARAVMDAAAAREQGTRDERLYTVLQAGTARMGRDPATSVIDPSGQAHEVKNLYVADASGFPSSSGAPFTLTIVANALRVAAGIAERGRRGEL